MVGVVPHCENALPSCGCGRAGVLSVREHAIDTCVNPTVHSLFVIAESRLFVLCPTAVGWQEAVAGVTCSG